MTDFPTVRTALMCCLALLPLSSPGTAAAEVVELKNGNTVTGDVLKETDQHIYVDIGIEILRVPLEQIQARKADEETGKVTEESADDIFRTAQLPVRSVKELSARFGEGVVLIRTPSGLGSGWIINDRGYCITNYHVVEQETRITATIFLTSNGNDLTRRRIEDVRILALNPFFDLALLQIPKPDDYDFQPLYLAPDDSLREGDMVFAIGNPLGLERSVSQGIVSTRNRSFEGVVYIQTTAEINPGNSGGPLFDTRGQVVGVTNMKLIGGEGLGFAIPITYVKHFLRHRDAFAYDRNQPNSGIHYFDPPRRGDFSKPPEPNATE